MYAPDLFMVSQAHKVLIQIFRALPFALLNVEANERFPKVTRAAVRRAEFNHSSWWRTVCERGPEFGKLDLQVGLDSLACRGFIEKSGGR